MTNKKSTKRSLIMSGLALFICISMFIGSTYAWFTDSVISGNNKIVAGNLDVALYHTNGTDTDEEVTDTTKLFDEVALWEPGAMVWEKLTVRNLGSLALKYTLSVNVSDVSVVNGKSLADVLKVAVMTEQPTRDNIKTATTQDLETFALKGEGVLDTKTGVDTF
ncbi:MAG: TasA family protein, partial [Acutalibacteraceae bacterium]|nr:TasA family protein [Acutalibacteraceae bacterium]